MTTSSILDTKDQALAIKKASLIHVNEFRLTYRWYPILTRTTVNNLFSWYQAVAPIELRAVFTKLAFI
ncbi:hypothetical protein ACKGJO_06265 [Gracilimonas sp. Q87]|uniref:hypothetical protein n=1 Tax=Gracilimonas sp. Q87 TaxID=3384766 RepID=UPI003984355C